MTTVETIAARQGFPDGSSVSERRENRMIRKRMVLLFGAAIMALVSMFALAGPASAASKSCTAGNYGYVSTVNWALASNVTFQNWSITGTVPMEYRVRWFAPAGNVIYDTGYVAWQPTSPVSATVNQSRYFNNPSQILVNAGKYGDGVATCEMWYTVPGV